MQRDRFAASEPPEHRGMPHLTCRDIECAQFALERLGVVDQGQQIGERDQLAIVEPTGDEAGVTVASLLAIRHHIHAGAQLRVDREADGVVGRRVKLGVGQPTFHVLMQGPQQPARARPTADAHDRQGRDDRRRCRLWQTFRNGDRNGHPRRGNRNRRVRSRRNRALGECPLADQEGGGGTGRCDRDQLVLREAAPRRQVFPHRAFGGDDFQQLAAPQRIDVLPDQQQQAVAAVEVAAIESGVRRMRVDGHRLQYDRQGVPSDRNSTSLAPPTIVAPATSACSSSLRFLKQGEQTQILPPALMKFAIRSASGAKPSSCIGSAKPLCASFTPSTERNTSVSCADATAALAMTKATVALSVLSLA